MKKKAVKKTKNGKSELITKTKKRIFVKEYISNGHVASRAYQKMAPKVTDDTARTEGSRLLKLPDVQELIREEFKRIGERMDITIDLQIARLEQMYFETQDLKVLQELNKLLGLYAPEKTINKNINAEVELTDDEKQDLLSAFGESSSPPASSGK